MTDHRGLFLDLDGTLANSLKVLREAYDRFLIHYGCTPSTLQFDSLNGPKLQEIVVILKKAHALSDSEDLLLSLYNGFIDAAYVKVRANPGAIDLLQQARFLGWTTTLVTSNSSARTRQWLSNEGLLDQMDFIVTGEQATQGKPCPDLYLIALEESGCVAKSSWAVEDSLNGVEAAKSAGIFTVAFAPGATQTRSSAACAESVHSLIDVLAYLQ